MSPPERCDDETSVRAYVALGSNLGDREALLRGALIALDAHHGVDVVAVSHLYETAPVGPAGQGPYLNAVIGTATTLSAGSLLDLLLSIETAAGRRRQAEVRWGARTLDLDLLLYGAEQIAEPGLVVPHPRLAERPFVLEPLAELAPNLVHPTLALPIEKLAARVRDPDAVCIWPAPSGSSAATDREGGKRWPSSQ